MHHRSRLAASLLALSSLVAACTDAPDDVTADQALLGPPTVGTSTSWVPTGIVTPAQGFALADTNGKVHAFTRTATGQLAVAPALANPTVVAGAPKLSTAGHIAAAYHAPSRRVFVAYADENNLLTVGQATASDTGALSGWTFTSLATSIDAAPAIAVGCDRVVVSFERNGAVYAMFKPAAGSAWLPSPGILAFARPGSRPAMASNGRGDVAIFAPTQTTGVHAITATCTSGATSPTWRTQTVGASRQAFDTRVGAVGYGATFAIAIRGVDNQGYFLSQTLDTLRQPVWIDAYDKITAAPLAGEPSLGEAPTLYNFRGTMFAAARTPGNELYYWVRNPNTLLALPGAPMWTGGKIVGGAGTSATPPAMVATGRLDRNAGFNQVNVTSELYLATRGINDQQLYALNLGRAATLDIVGTQYGVRWDTNFELAGIPTRDVPNLPEHLLSFLSSPSTSWKDQSAPSYCGLKTQVTFIPDSEREVAISGCNQPWEPLLKLNGNNGSRALLWQEWQHFSQSGSSTLKQLATYKALFDEPLPKTCTTSANCGNATCKPASQVGGDVYARVLAVHNQDVSICESEPGRALGFEWDYDFTGNEHAFGDLAYAYRFFGDQVRDDIRTDAAFGDDLLYRKYMFIRERYYGGVEFNGAEPSSTAGSTGDEALGVYAMPISHTPIPGMDVTVHLSGLGDRVTRAWFADPEYAGTRNQGRQLEGFAVAFHPAVPGLGMRYMAHLSDIGDTAWVDAPTFIGTRGQNRRLEGFAIQLTGALASRYDVVYSCNINGGGDSPYIANGAFCGTRGQGLRLEGITVRIVPRSLAARSGY